MLESLGVCIFRLNVPCLYMQCLTIITIISWCTLFKYGQIKKRHSKSYEFVTDIKEAENDLLNPKFGSQKSALL